MTYNLDKRNWKIYFEWIEGKDYTALSAEYELAASTIKEIVTAKIPQWVKDKPWLTANSYKKFREQERKQRTEYKERH